MNSYTRNMVKWLRFIALLVCTFTLLIWGIYLSHKHLHSVENDTSVVETTSISTKVETSAEMKVDIPLQKIEEPFIEIEVPLETVAETTVEEPVVLMISEPEPEVVEQELPDIIDTLEVRLFNDHKRDFNLVDGRAYLDVVSMYLHMYAPKGMYLSAALAQSYTEGGAGKAGVYTLTNNCFGITATPSWKGYVFSRTTQLVYKDYSTAKAYGATDLFRAYDSIEDSVIDYVSLIQTKRYDEALFTTSPKEYLSHLLNNGYGEKESLYVWMEMIDLYDLHEVDSLRETEDVQLFVS